MSWKGNVIHKQDVLIAKNYLNEDEMDNLNRFVTVFLETAELRAKNRQQIKMDFWRDNIDRIIEFNDKVVLQGRGSISNEQMEELAFREYKTFDSNRKLEEARQADKEDLAELQNLEEEIKRMKL